MEFQSHLVQCGGLKLFMGIISDKNFMLQADTSLKRCSIGNRFSLVCLCNLMLLLQNRYVNASQTFLSFLLLFCWEFSVVFIVFCFSFLFFFYGFLLGFRKGGRRIGLFFSPFLF